MRERVCGKPRGDAQGGMPMRERVRGPAGRLLLSSGNDQKGARMWQKVHPPSETMNCE